MRKTHLAAFLCIVVAALPLSGCSKIKARSEMKEGNRYYKDEAYKDALAQFQKSLVLDPSLAPAWRSVGLAAMALYRPGNDSPETVKYATTAIEAFKNYSGVPRGRQVDYQSPPGSASVATTRAIDTSSSAQRTREHQAHLCHHHA
jgi:tetratricopeptide (TPR) repeat protein